MDNYINQQKAAQPVQRDAGHVAGKNATLQLKDNRPKSVLQQKRSEDAGQPLQKKTNRTGLPDNLKGGIEDLSGITMDDVQVHYNSSKPAELNAHAYAQGPNIHLAPGQEKHLPHEAWHVVQQKQGRVKPTIQLKGKVNVNDDKGLEKEADVMGMKARQFTNPGLEFDNEQKRSDLNLYTGQVPVAQAFFSNVDSAQKEIVIERVKKFINEHNPEKMAVLDEFIRKAKSEEDEGTSEAFLTPNEIFISAMDEYAAPESGPSINAGGSASASGSDQPLSQIPTSQIERHQGSSSSSSSSSNTALKSASSQSKETIEDEINKVALLCYNELKLVMSDDRTGAYKKSPTDQLQQCLEDCKKLTADEVATYLYTTYFYQPLNGLLRDRTPTLNGLFPDPKPMLHKSLYKLINTTIKRLDHAIKSAEVQDQKSNFRMELKPSWIGETKIGGTLKFAGFTSTHPDISGVNNMWRDIENKTFGDYEGTLALLVFEGVTKVLRPIKKYFKKEVEDILPRGLKCKIMKKYNIECTIKGKKRNVDVYHLMVQPFGKEVSASRYRFDEHGKIHAYEESSADSSAMSPSAATAAAAAATPASSSSGSHWIYSDK